MERQRSAAALKELLEQWSCQVKVVHTKEDWELEWKGILAHALHVEAERAQVRTVGSTTGVTTMIDSIQSCRPVLVSSSGPKSSFSYDVVTPKNTILSSPAPYDLILILDTMLDDSFAPYSAFQIALAEQRAKGMQPNIPATVHTRVNSFGVGLPPQHVAPLRSEQVQLQHDTHELLTGSGGAAGGVNPSTCTTAESTPSTPARRLSLTELNAGVSSISVSSSPTIQAHPPQLLSSNIPLLTSLTESICFAPLPLPAIVQTKSDGATDMMVAAMKSASGGGGGVVVSPGISSPSTPVSTASTPSSVPALPSFLLLLSHTPRHARHSASPLLSLSPAGLPPL